MQLDVFGICLLYTQKIYLFDPPYQLCLLLLSLVFRLCARLRFSFFLCELGDHLVNDEDGETEDNKVQRQNLDAMLALQAVQVVPRFVSILAGVVDLKKNEIQGQSVRVNQCLSFEEGNAQRHFSVLSRASTYVRADVNQLLSLLLKVASNVLSCRKKATTTTGLVPNHANEWIQEAGDTHR